MKIAALYDIHGNLPALNAVLDDLDTVMPDLIVIGGDCVAGPMPPQTLDRLNLLGDRVRFIRGNGDREVVQAYDGQPFAEGMPEPVRDVMRWVASQLTSAQRDQLANLPEQLSLHQDGLGDVLFCHATPRTDEEIFTSITPDDRLQIIFSSISQQIVVCGHTHSQFERRLSDGLRIVNSGSVGMPYEDQPGAYWLLLSQDGYEHHRTDYDLQAAAREIEETGYPRAAEFAESNVLHVTPAAETTALFERMSAERWSR